MRDFREVIRREAQRSPIGVRPSDASAKTPPKGKEAIDVPLTPRKATTSNRNEHWDSGNTVSNLFADFRRVIPSAGANLWGRILRWLELRAFTESVDYQSGSAFHIDPRKANNTIANATGLISIIFPDGYAGIGGAPALQERSEIEQQMEAVYSRAILTPHTVWIYHNGHTISSLGALLPDGEDIPADDSGLTLISCAHVVVPGGVSKWRVLGMKHYSS